jgi:hypothetical protein
MNEKLLNSNYFQLDMKFLENTHMTFSATRIHKSGSQS